MDDETRADQPADEAPAGEPPEAAEPESKEEPGGAETEGEPGYGAEAEADDRPSSPPSLAGRLARLYAQWTTPGRPRAPFWVLHRTVVEDPDQLPAFELLGLADVAIDDAWSAWEPTQVASDATPLGRGLRPLVVLVPAGGRWIAGRSLGLTCILEPLDHPTPGAALRAAEARFRLITAGRVGEVLDELAAILEDDAAPVGVAPDEAQPAGTEPAEPDATTGARAAD